jgi:hypothetical protein
LLKQKEDRINVQEAIMIYLKDQVEYHEKQQTPKGIEKPVTPRGASLQSGCNRLLRQAA